MRGGYPLIIALHSIVLWDVAIIECVVGGEEHPGPASIISARQQSNRLYHVDAPQPFLSPIPALPTVEKVHCSLVIQQTHQRIDRHRLIHKCLGHHKYRGSLTDGFTNNKYTDTAASEGSR